jgi:hypothetical protein
MLVAAFVAAAGVYTSGNSRMASRQQGIDQLVVATDSCMELAFATWKAAIAAKSFRAPLTTDLTGIKPSAMASTHSGWAKAGITFPQLTIDTVDSSGAHVDPDAKGALTPESTQNVDGYPGWTGFTYYYKVDATAASTKFGSNGTPLKVHVTRYFQYTQMPLFQAAIFYENKLEIHPGSPMTVTGLVHTNSDLWAQGFSTLQFMNNVSYVNSFHEGADQSVRFGWDGQNAGSFPPASQQITWADGATSSTSNSMSMQLRKVSKIDPFGGTSTSNNGLRAIIDVPPPGDTSDQKIYNNASLYVTFDSTKQNKGITVTAANGISLTNSDIQNVANAVSMGGTIYDQREKTNVSVTTIDVAKLNIATGADPAPTPPATPLPPAPAGSLRAKNGTGIPLFNGVIYIQDLQTKAGKKNSVPGTIRLQNARSIPVDMTFATPNPIYVQGDFNTGGTSPSQVPSNLGNPHGSAPHVAPGYSQASVAIMADSITVLSNNWNDANSAGALSGRVATATTINAAFLAGDVPSNLNNNGYASGGAHNFPRLLENWSSVDFTYWGSMFEAFYSTEFTGTWGTGAVYSWPNRRWNFEPQFLNRPPPGSPQGLMYSRGRWERN